MATLKKIVIIINGPVEAYYTTDSSEGPQNAAMPLPDDVSALIASAQAQLDANIGALTPQTTKPAELVAAVTALGKAKADEADARRRLDALNAQIAEKQAQADALDAAAVQKAVVTP